MIVIDNGHDNVIWLIIVYHIMQTCNTDNHTIWTFHNVSYFFLLHYYEIQSHILRLLCHMTFHIIKYNVYIISIYCMTMYQFLMAETCNIFLRQCFAKIIVLVRFKLWTAEICTYIFLRQCFAEIIVIVDLKLWLIFLCYVV